MIGRIHSFETFSTADGEGIRFVVFFQGCNFRCVFCHNPDTWNGCGGTKYTAKEIITKMLEYESFYRSSGGGLTASGGEPLLQAQFLAELFKLAHEANINTCLDTAGDTAELTDSDIGDILAHTDSVLLDIKETDEARHRKLTGRGRPEVLRFLHELQAHEIPTRLRYVYIKGVNDSKDTLDGLKTIKREFSCIQGIDVLPYHRLGEHKWKKLGIEYTLKGAEPPTGEQIEAIKEYLC